MRTQAIIIRKIPIRESDELVICYTRKQGKQAYRARSSSRSSSKQGSHLDVLNHVDFSLVQGNGHPIITSATCLDSLRTMKSNLKTLSVGFFLAECFDKLVFNAEPDEKLWDFLYSRLTRLDKTQNIDNIDPKILCETNRGDLLDTMGYGSRANLYDLHPREFTSLSFAKMV